MLSRKYSSFPAFQSPNFLASGKIEEFVLSEKWQTGARFPCSSHLRLLPSDVFFYGALQRGTGVHERLDGLPELREHVRLRVAGRPSSRTGAAQSGPGCHPATTLRHLRSVAKVRGTSRRRFGSGLLLLTTELFFFLIGYFVGGSSTTKMRERKMRQRGLRKKIFIRSTASVVRISR